MIPKKILRYFPNITRFWEKLRSFEFFEIKLFNQKLKLSVAYRTHIVVKSAALGDCLMLIAYLRARARTCVCVSTNLYPMYTEQLWHSVQFPNLLKFNKILTRASRACCNTIYFWHFFVFPSYNINLLNLAGAKLLISNSLDLWSFIDSLFNILQLYKSLQAVVSRN